MSNTGSVTVYGDDGLQGQIESALQTNNGEVTNVLVHLDSGQRIVLPIDTLTRQKDGTYYVSLSHQDVLQQHGGDVRFDEHVTLPIINEVLTVHKEQVAKGGIRLTKHVHEREEVVDEVLMRETAAVSRIPINQIVEEPVQVRLVDDVYIIPIMEEVLVAEKRLLLKEEIHVHKNVTEYREPQKIVLRQEEIDVEHFEGDSGVRSKTS